MASADYVGADHHFVSGALIECTRCVCSGGLACVAKHISNRRGVFLDFGFPLGFALCIRASFIDGAGLGLFSKRYFQAGSIITVYDGHVTHKTGVPVRPHQAQGPAFSHLHSIPRSDFVVWGFRYPTHGRGVGSFANHSCQPNARVTLRNGVFPYLGSRSCPLLTTHLIVIATADVHPDQEITINYGRNNCARLGIPYD